MAEGGGSGGGGAGERERRSREGEPARPTGTGIDAPGGRSALGGTGGGAPWRRGGATSGPGAAGPCSLPDPHLSGMAAVGREPRVKR